jgi:hypothetical protein
MVWCHDVRWCVVCGVTRKVGVGVGVVCGVEWCGVASVVVTWGDGVVW